MNQAVNRFKIRLAKRRTGAGLSRENGKELESVSEPIHGPIHDFESEPDLNQKPIHMHEQAFRLKN